MEEDSSTTFATMIRSERGRGGLIGGISNGRTDGRTRLDLDDYSSSDGEDDVFIPSANGDAAIGLATKVLLHPRRKAPSGGYQVSTCRFSIKCRYHMLHNYGAI